MPGFVGLEYFEIYKHRFVEMINFLSLTQSINPDQHLNVLECGSIFTTKLIKTMFPQLRISVLDFLDIDQIAYGSIFKLRDLVQKYYKIDLVHDTIDGVILEPKPVFDVVLLCEVIEHLLVNPRKVIKFFLGNLKQGGCIYITTPNFFKKGNNESFKRRVNPSPLFPEDYTINDAHHFHIREYGMGELLQIAHSSGGSIHAFYFSSCWDAPPAKPSPNLSNHELSNLVIVVRKQ